MSTKPLISVVIPTYNRGRQTIEAIESALAQSVSDLEVIVINDGSTDESREVLRLFISTKNSQSIPIHLVDQQNRGQSAARNTGVAKAQGDYVAFLDSDDLWEPNKLEWQLKAFEKFGGAADACFTDVQLVNDAGMSVKSFDAHAKHYQEQIGIDRGATAALAQSFCGFWLSSLLVRKDTLQNIGGFDSGIRFGEDRDMEFRLSLVSPFAYVNLPLVRSDRNPSPSSSNCRPWDNLEVQFREQRHMLTKWLKGSEELPASVRRSIETALGGLHSHEANWHLEHSRYAEARAAMALAVGYKRTPGTIAKFMLTWLIPPVAKSLAPRIRPIGTEGHAS